MRQIADGEAVFSDLVRAFPDPGQAFVCSPVQITIRQLAQAYGEEVPEEERHRFLGNLRQRQRHERWIERRAMYQSARHTAKRDAILDAEAQVWAVLGLEFHQLRIRSMWDRWQMLDDYVTRSLASLEMGEGAFTTNVRDAMKELRDVEASLTEVMPKLGIPDRAMQRWNDRAGSREDLVRSASNALTSIEGDASASNVFNMFDRLTEAEGGG